MSNPKCDPRFDSRLIAQTQLARVGSGEKVQWPIMKYVDGDGKTDESKVWVLSVNGYVLFDKQDVSNAYLGYLRSEQ